MTNKDLRFDVITSDFKPQPKYLTKCPTCLKYGKTETITRQLKFQDECYWAFGYVCFWKDTLLTKKQILPIALKMSGYSLSVIQSYLGHKYRSQTQGLIERAVARLKLATDFVQLDKNGVINYCSNDLLKNSIKRFHY